MCGLEIPNRADIPQFTS